MPSNLTEAIKKTNTIFSLNLLDQTFGEPYYDELSAFNDDSIDANYSLIRKVFLEGDKQPMVFARVIIPEKTYLNYHTEFSSLGGSAIGNTILYADKHTIRQDFEYKLVANNDPMFHELKELHQVADDDGYWARRSVFMLPKGPLLITELFLNTIIDYPF